MDLSFLNKYNHLAHWALRLAIAGVFLFHGIDKFINIGAISEMMGMPTAVIGLLGAAETAAGVLVLLGGLLNTDWMTRLAGAIVIPVMIGAIAMVHWPAWSFMQNGMEFQVTLILISVFLLLKGNTMGQQTSAV